MQLFTYCGEVLACPRQTLHSTLSYSVDLVSHRIEPSPARSVYQLKASFRYTEARR